MSFVLFRVFRGSIGSPGQSNDPLNTRNNTNQKTVPVGAQCDF